MSYNYAQHHSMGKLLAGMTKADRRLLRVEDVNAKRMLKGLLPQSSKMAIEAYCEHKNVYSLTDVDHCYGALLAGQPISSKINFLSVLKVIAECDGEFHDDEKAFILRVAHQMMVSVDGETDLIESLHQRNTEFRVH